MVNLINRTLPNQEPGEPFGGQQPLDAEAAAVEAAAMPPERFWALIDVLQGSTDDEAIEQLTEALTELEVEELAAFDARLTLALYQLDYRARYDWLVANDPSGLGYVGDDGFLYSRGDTIAAGQEVYEEAISNGTLPWGTVDPEQGGGELLLSVAGEAAYRAGVVDEFDERVRSIVTISYETGSNPAGGW